MDISRRTWLAGIGAAASTQVLAQAGGSGPTLGRTQPSFGPPPGEAHLVFNENPYGPAPSAIRAQAAMANKGAFYIDDVQPQLAAMIARRHGLAPEQVVIGNGSFEVLTATALAFADRGAIVHPELMFDEPLKRVEPLGIELQSVPMTAELGVDLAGLAALAGPDTGMIWLCNPNNPTGVLVPPAQLRAFIRALPERITVVVDEAYMELTDDPVGNSMVDLVREGRNVIVSRTFSKIHGMAGLRVGYALAGKAAVERIAARMLTISLSAPALAAALASYDDTDFLRFSLGKVREARGMLTTAATGAGLRALPSQTNFLFVEVPDADRLQKAMAAERISIRGSYGPKWQRWSRVSCGRIEDVARYCEALPRLVKA